MLPHTRASSSARHIRPVRACVPVPVDRADTPLHSPSSTAHEIAGALGQVEGRLAHPSRERPRSPPPHRRQGSSRGLTERQMLDGMELDEDLATALLHRLAGTQPERHASPPIVVDEHRRLGERLGVAPRWGGAPILHDQTRCRAHCSKASKRPRPRHGCRRVWLCFLDHCPEFAESLGRVGTSSVLARARSGRARVPVGLHARVRAGLAGRSHLAYLPWPGETKHPDNTGAGRPAWNATRTWWAHSWIGFARAGSVAEIFASWAHGHAPKTLTFGEC